MNDTCPLLIGAAAADITPPVGVTLSGYRPRRAEAVGHPLRAEALVCRGKRRAWALLTSDVIGFSLSLTRAIRRAVRTAIGLPPSAVMVAGTHTHSGPSTLWFGEETPTKADRDYLESLPKKLADLVQEAWRRMTPGRFETAWLTVSELGSNRRIQQADGAWTNEWQDPEGRHPGYFDPTVLLIGVRRPDERLDSLFVNYGVHPVVLGPESRQISADYPGYVKETLEATGEVQLVHFILAGAANINPRHCILVGAEHPRRTGEVLAARVRAALPSLKPMEPGEPQYRRRAWIIRRTQPALPGKTRRPCRAFANIHTEMQALCAGEIVWFGLPGEVFSEYNARLRTIAAPGQMAIVSLANDYIGYFPTAAALAEGAYEARMAPSSDIESSLMENAERLLHVFSAAGRRIETLPITRSGRKNKA